jgi:hypothetical protein
MMVIFKSRLLHTTKRTILGPFLTTILKVNTETIAMLHIKRKDKDRHQVLRQVLINLRICCSISLLQNDNKKPLHTHHTASLYVLDVL